MLVAEGAVEIGLDPEVSLWDLAAPMVVVQEAGGRFTDLARRGTADGGDGLASNGSLHEAALAFVARWGPRGGAAVRRCGRGRMRRGAVPEAGRYRWPPGCDRQTLDEIVGQERLLSAGSALRRAIEEGHPHSMILHGPPGSGKTTLARLVASTSGAAFEEEARCRPAAPRSVP